LSATAAIAAAAAAAAAAATAFSFFLDIFDAETVHFASHFGCRFFFSVFELEPAQRYKKTKPVFAPENAEELVFCLKRL